MLITALASGGRQSRGGPARHCRPTRNRVKPHRQNIGELCTEHCAQNHPCGTEIAGQLARRTQNARAETIARNFARVGEQRTGLRRLAERRAVRNRPLLRRHFDARHGRRRRERAIRTRGAVASGLCRIVRPRHVMSHSARMTSVLAANSHVIAATGLGPRRSEHDRRQQHKTCRRATAHQLPHKLRDHVKNREKELPKHENRKTEMKTRMILVDQRISICQAENIENVKPFPLKNAKLVSLG